MPEKHACVWGSTVDAKSHTHLRTTHLWCWSDSHPLLVQLRSRFNIQILAKSGWVAGQRPKGALNSPLFTLKVGWIMPQSYALKRGHGCTTFSRNSFVLLCCLYSLGGSSFLVKSIQASFHLSYSHHLLSEWAWDSFTISFKFASCKRSSILGVQEPSLGGRGDPKSHFLFSVFFPLIQSFPLVAWVLFVSCSNFLMHYSLIPFIILSLILFLSFVLYTSNSFLYCSLA